MELRLCFLERHYHYSLVNIYNATLTDFQHISGVSAAMSEEAEKQGGKET